MYPNHEQPTPLQAFVDAKRLRKKGVPLSQLQCMRASKQVVLVFDGNKVLDDITKMVQKRDPLATYTSSTPPDAYAKCSEYVNLATTLQESFPEGSPEFKPMFVFDGCGFVPYPEVDTNAPTPPGELLNMFSQGREVCVSSIPEVMRKRISSRFSIGEDLEGRIVRIIRESVRDTIRAPYLAWSQISALFAPAEQRASEVYGCLELLAFPGIRRVITNIDSEKGTFDYVDQKEFLEAAMAVKQGLQELDVVRAVLLLSRNRQFHIHCLDNMNLESLLSQFPFEEVVKRQADDARRRLMQRNIAALDAPVLTTTDGIQYLSTLYNLTKTSDVRLVFGTQAPTMLYYFVMTGPVMPKPFATFCQKVLADDWPLVDSTAYRKVAENILPLRVQVAFQLFQAVESRNKSGYPVGQDIVWLRQYSRYGGHNSMTPDRRISKIIHPPEIHLTYWDVSDDSLYETQEAIYFSDIIPLADRSTQMETRYHTMGPTLATILLRSLDLLGYFTHSTEGNEASGPSVYTQALSQFNCPTLSEYGVLLIELVRTFTLNDRPIQTTLNQNSAPEIRPGVRFASRLLSIIPINTNNTWTGPFDVEMAAFGMNTRLLSSTLRHLTEVNAVLMFYKEKTTLPLDQLDAVISKLPFTFPIEFNAGFVMQWILTHLHPAMTVDDVVKAFPQLYNPEEDLDTLFWFWSMAYMALTIIRSEEPTLVDGDVLFAAHALVVEACRIIRPKSYEFYLQPLESYYPPFEPPVGSMAPMDPMGNNGNMMNMMPMMNSMNGGNRPNMMNPGNGAYMGNQYYSPQ